ncbi:PleD family two-component system response regulator [Sphingobacterium sp. SGR-19]|uniref:response regulator n=1 Tax=Sphingobacterium sp. SGR-19 TaxID=2710886 RepID=UPI0013EC1703|nr:response regulator [Sphingobacterium sp. SGR-19]NGM66929.1 response regulator [Sphingobacterium sp. SGR-19]
MYKKKVFICDDDSGILEVLKLILESADAEIIAEQRSAHAFERIIREKPDILIVDLWMPEVSGHQLMREARNNDDLQDMYIICISASYDGEEIAKDAGADVFLPKPFDMEAILSLVQDS